MSYDLFYYYKINNYICFIYPIGIYVFVYALNLSELIYQHHNSGSQQIPPLLPNELQIKELC